MGLRIRRMPSIKYQLLTTLVAVFALVMQPMYGLIVSQVANAVSDTVSTESDLRLAITNGKTNITLIGEIGVNSQITVSGTTTFNGGTIKSLTAGAYGSNDAVVYVTGSNAVFTANGTVFDGNKKAERQGVKVYDGAKTFLNNVTIKNATKAGLHVNGTSEATVKDVTTSNNGTFFGGLVVSGGGTIDINGKSTHSETLKWDARIDGSGTINDNNQQYTTGNTRQLKSAPGAPTITAPVTATPVTTNSTNVTWNAPSTSGWGNPNAADSYIVTVNGGTPVTVTGTTHTLTGLTNGTHTVTVQSVAKSGLVGGTATRTFTVAIPDTEAPVGTATYAGGYLDSNGVRYVQKIEDLSFTANITDNVGVARATYRAINVTNADEACGNWGDGSLTSHSFTAPFQPSISYTVAGSSIKTCDPSMKWESGSRYSFIHGAYDAAGNEGKFNVPTQQLVEIDSTQPVIEIINPLANSTVKGIVPVEVKMTENGSGVKYVNAKINEGHQGGVETPTASLVLKEGTTDVYVGQIDTTGMDRASLRLTVSASDNVGNTKSAATANTITIDNTAPKITSVSFKEIRSYGTGPNFTGAQLNSNKLAVTFTTSEPLKLNASAGVLGSQVSLKVPGVHGSAPSTGWTTIQQAEGTNEYVANIDLINRTDTGIPGYANFFKDKFFADINLYFQLTDAIGNTKNTYLAIDPTTNKPIDDWTTNSGDARNYKFSLDNKAPVLKVSKDFSKPLSNNDSIIVNATDDSGIREIHANIRKVNANGTVDNTVVGGLKFTFDRNDVQTEVDHEVKLGNLVNGAGLESGKYEFRISGVDLTLNNSGQQKFLFTVNNQAPKAEVTVGGLATGDFTNNKNITITGTGTPRTYGTPIKTHFFELKTPLATYAIYSDKTANRCTLDGTNKCSFNLADYYDGDGKYEVRYVVTDEQGLRNDGHQQPWVNDKNSATFTFNVDTIPPVVTIDESSATRTSISGTVGLDAVKVFVKVGGVEHEVTPNNGTWSFNFSPVLTVGTHNVTVWAVDAAGNTNAVDTIPEWATGTIEVEDNSTGEVTSTPPSDSQASASISLPSRLSTFASTVAIPRLAINVDAADLEDDEAADPTPAIRGVSDRRTSATNSSDESGVKGAEDSRASWSVVNAVLAAIATIAGLMALLGLFKKREEGEESRNGTRIAAVVLGAVSVATLLFIEDFSAAMSVANWWTILFAAVAIAQIAIVTKLKAPQE
ncbi:MAG: Ig-like domain-containing protein [Candidatus Saccharimonadales bacterium]